MSSKRKKVLDDNCATSEIKRARSGYFAENLKKLHSTFAQKAPNLNLKLEMDDSHLVIEWAKPSFLRHLSQHSFQPISSFLSQPSNSLLKIFLQNDNEIIIFEKHMLDSLENSISSSNRTIIPFLTQTYQDWQCVKESVERIFRSGVSQYALLDIFFTRLASWMQIAGLKVMVQKVEHEEATVMLEIRKEIRNVYILVTVFTRDWAERPKLVVEMPSGQSTIIKNQGAVQQLMKQTGNFLKLPKPGTTLRNFMDHRTNICTTSAPTFETANEEVFFINSMCLLFNQQKGTRMQTLNGRTVCFNQKQQISLADCKRLELSSNSVATSMDFKLTVELLMGNLGFSVQESLYHGELLPGNWENKLKVRLPSAIGRLVKSWELQVNLLKEFFEELDHFLESKGLSMKVANKQNVVTLSMELANGPLLELKCQMMAPWVLRPLIQMEIGQEYGGTTFQCKNRKQICFMLKRFNWFASGPEPIGPGEGQIVVEVIEEERKIKEEKEATVKAGEETLATESDCWTKLENLKEEIDS